MTRMLLQVVLAGALGVSSGAYALPWVDDMRDQTSENTQQSLVEMPEGTVPVDGGEPLRPPRDAAELVRARLHAAALSNPFAADQTSLDRGEAVYRTYCLACHGSGGRGDGPVGQKFELPPPIDLTYDYVQNQPDGQIYYTITHGSVVMPGYRHSVQAEDRWHLVNYIKTLTGER